LGNRTVPSGRLPGQFPASGEAEGLVCWRVRQPATNARPAKHGIQYRFISNHAGDPVLI
jgi:hypothetical protein